jgi:SAM-dependent methyltransferase
MATSDPDAKARFSTRVGDYARHRPRYPDAVYGFLRAELVIGPGAVVADVGSGTGIFAGPLLEAGCTVICVEPNRAMREAAEGRLGAFAGFRSVAGSAEATTLADRSVDLVVAAQAFHWFDPVKASGEFRRVLRPGTSAVLVWNTRRTGGTPFMEGYEALLDEFGTDYAAVRHDRQDPGRLAQFFPAGFRRVAFANEQRLDRDALRGRLLSSSYTPGAEDPRREPMLRALDRLFDQFNASGRVTIDYDTEVYFGTLR